MYSGCELFWDLRTRILDPMVLCRAVDDSSVEVRGMRRTVEVVLEERGDECVGVYESVGDMKCWI